MEHTQVSFTCPTVNYAVSTNNLRWDWVSSTHCQHDITVTVLKLVEIDKEKQKGKS